MAAGRFFRWSITARVLLLPAFLLNGTAWAQSPATSPDQTPVATEAAAAPSFTVRIEAPDAVRAVLERHLELMRFRTLADLGDSELNRLVKAADSNARELLATLGYFAPQVRVTREGPTRREVRIQIETGAPTRVQSVDIQFTGDVATRADAEPLRARLRAGWPLRPGMPFTQSAWDDAKTEVQRQLTAQRYPTGTVADSRADVDADQARAALHLRLDSGPLYRLGPLRITGVQRYDPVMVERLARLTPGTPYDQAELLEAQQRLARSGYFDSVMVSVDTSGDPNAAPVDIQLREAQRQKVILGVGASTDSGLRSSVEYTHHRLPWLGWRAVSKLQIDRESREFTSELTGTPDAHFWRWYVGGSAARMEYGGLIVTAQTLRTGRRQTSEARDIDYYLQYDRAYVRGTGLSARADALSANIGWTLRRFETLPFPTRGWGLGLTVGGGTTLENPPRPYLRTTARWLGYLPLDRADASANTSAPIRSRRGRLALRAEGGAVLAQRGADLPSSQLFLTGGDTTVRGYGLREIGVVEDGHTVAGRYMAVGSVEWQRPLAELGGLLGGFESVLFVDAGAVANRVGALRAKVGLGAGLRWRSPIGPLQVDVAWGRATRKFRLHLTVGFTF